jgi:DNA (cytosine-5)-methyltransferase 1
MENKNISVLELFGGIGACTKALKNIGMNVNVVDYVEIDKYAVKSYNAINNTNFEPQDITKWNKDINIDLIMHGSPCQDYSISGLQMGGDEGSGTRSSLMYESIRIINKLKPKYVVWENVKNLLSKKHKHNFDNYINKLDELGYNSYYKVLDAKDYGVAQHRERIYTVSIRKDIDKGSFKFPEKEPLKIFLKDLLEKEVDEKYYLNDKQLISLKNSTFNSRKTRIQEKDYCDILCTRDFKDPKCIQIGNLNIKGNDSIKRVYSPEGISPTLTTCGGGNTQAKIKDGNNIRKLIPLEYWRLMSFDDEDFYKVKKSGMSDSQLYKQAGNSIVVKVLEKIFLNLFKGD